MRRLIDFSDYDSFPFSNPPTAEELAAMAEWYKKHGVTVGVDPETGMPTYTLEATLRIDQPRRMFVGRPE